MRPLEEIFRSLTQVHVCRADQPLPPLSHGKSWLIAANGIWLRGHNGHLTAIVPVQRVSWRCPACCRSLPSVTWRVLGRLPDGQPRRLPARPLLVDMLAHARQVAITAGGPDRQIEQQYHIVRRGRWLLPIIPQQQAGAGTVSYQMPDVPAGDILLDLHSHGNLPAFFSATDTQDDNGLSVSAVIGSIFDVANDPVPVECLRDTRGGALHGGL